MKLPRRYRVLLMAVVSLFVLWLIYYAAVSVIYGIKLRNLKAEVQADGSSLDLVKLGNLRAVIFPDDANAGFLYQAAPCLMGTSNGQHTPEATAYDDFAKTQQTATRAKLVSEKRAELETWLRESVMSLQLLHRAAQYEHAWFNLDYSEGYHMRLPHLAPLLDGARLLSLEAWVAAEQGDAHKALQATWAALRLRHATEDEPILISQLVGIRTNSIALSTLQEIMPAIQPQEADLRLILTELQSRNAKSFRLAVEGERATGYMAFEAARKNGLADVVPYLLGDQDLAEWKLQVFGPATVRILDTLPMDEAYYLSHVNRFVDAASNVESLTLADARRMEDSILAVRRNYSVWHPLSPMLMPALGRSLVEAKKNIAHRDVALCGIAAELYRLDHGAYPASLNALVPKYLSALPQDTFSGKALLFEALPNGVLIQSVGAYDETRPRKSEFVSPEPPIAWRVERAAAVGW